MDRFVGKRLDGRYEISELIGEGGMAAVYRAYDVIDERIVAIKILKEDFLANEEFKRRFKNESKAIAVLSHPNIVKVYDVSFGDVLQYIVMECCEGITLKEYIQSKGVIDWEEAAFFTTQILKALAHAHEKGIVHRDIKPQNIILLKDGTIKVADFGIARFSQSEQKTITDKAIGSVHYISPEQARGVSTDGKSDIYSVGVMLYEMTTGKLPFQADSAVSVAIMQLQNEPERPTKINSLIPKGLEQIILHAMQKEPRDRYSTSFEMLKAVEEVRRDPYIQFDYTYDIQSRPVDSKTVPFDYPTSRSDDFDINKHTEDIQEEESGKKSKTVVFLSIIASVCVLLVVAIGISMFTGKGFFFGLFSEEKTVPDFVGMTVREIRDDQEYRDYNLVFEEVVDKQAEHNEGEVFDQEPSAGKELKKNTRITLYVYSKGVLKDIPDITGETYEDALSILEDADFKNIKKYEEFSDEYEEGEVIKFESEMGGTSAYQNTLIKVYVSKGPEKVEAYVPNLIGSKIEDARRTLEERNLEIGAIIYEYNDQFEADYVYDQSPFAGASGVYQGDKVNIYVSKGPAPTVPTETTTQGTTIPAESTTTLVVSEQ